MGMHQMLGPSFGASDPDPVDVTRSLRFNSGDSAYLSRTPSSVGNRRTWTYSCWVKRTNIGGVYPRMFGNYTGGSYIGWDIEFNNSDKIDVHYDSGGGSYIFRRTTTQVFRDPSAWYHIVVAVDTTDATANDRVKLYVNGEQITAFDTNTNAAQDTDTNINTAVEHRIGYNYSYSDFYLANVEFIDGQALLPTKFGAFNDDGIWGPVEYSGSYGTNGFYLKFANNSSNAALGTDSSGNSNTWTVNNISATGFSSPTATSTGDPTSSTDSPFSSGYSVDFDGNDAIRFTGPGTITGDFTAECFVKSSSYGGTQRIFSADQAAQSGERLNLRCYNGNTEFYVAPGVSASGTNLPTNQWNHIAITRSGSTVSYYLNGSRWATDTYSSAISVTTFVVAHGFASEYFTGKISNARFVDGQALYTGSSYTQPTATLTTTSQGATAANVRLICCHQSSVTALEGSIGSSQNVDSLFDSPTNGSQSDTGAGGQLSGNYAVWNAVGPGGTSTYGTLSNGNLDVSLPASGRALAQTLFPQSGKWYIEIDFVSGGGAGGGLRIGVINENNIGIDLGSTADSWAYLADGRVYHNASAPSYGVSSAPGDKLMMALDIDAGKLWYGKNGTWMASGNPAAGSNPSQTFTAGQKMSFSAQSGSGTVQVINANWGQRAWTYTAPSGFKAVCTANLPNPTIADGSDYFDTKLYTGNGSTQSISGYGFSPDFVWIKCRSAAKSHSWFDSVRGATKLIKSDDTQQESTQSGGVTSFNSDGFSIGSRAGNNENNATFAAWAWDAGTSTVSNTDGSITSNVRASATSGFSIVSWTGTGATGSIGHGLNSKPQIVITKNRTDSAVWVVDVIDVISSGTSYMLLNTNQAASSGGSTADNSVVNILQYNDRNGSGDAMIAYCFTSVEGFSSIGKYSGNGSTDGPFVQTGFRPAFVMVKRTNSTEQWAISDTARDTYNPVDDFVWANANSAEDTNSVHDFDYLSNGFKLRYNHVMSNGSGSTYLYMAFAEHPFKTARAR